MTTTIEIEKLLPWGQPKEIDTKAGRKILRKAAPTDSFWATWRTNKEALKAAGISCGQYQGNWEIAWWQSPDPIKAAAEAQAKEAERKRDAQLTPEQEERFAALASKLLPYQLPSVRRQVDALTRFGGALDASDTGTGKTFVNLATTAVMGLPAFVVCPKAVKPSWIRAARDHFGIRLAGICNYEALREGNTPALTAKFTYVKKWVKGELVEKRELESMTWNLPKETVIILDEIHRAKDYKTLNSAMALAALSQGYKVLGLSATAADNPMQMKVTGLLTKCFENEKRFFPWMMKNGVSRGRFGFEFTGGRAVLDKIHQQIFPQHGTRIKIADLGDQFPETQIAAEAYDCNGAGEKIDAIYREMEAELAALSHKEQDDTDCVLTIRLRARQRTEILKTPAIAELAQNAVDEGMSVALFVNFDDSADSLAAKLKTKCCIRGSQHGPKGEAERQRAIDDFNADREPIIICNIKAGGIGVNLHGSPSSRMRMSIICVTDSAQDAKQALGRVWRAKGAKSIQKFFFAAGTIEESDILPNMRAKIDRIDTLNDGDLKLRCEKHLPTAVAVLAPPVTTVTIAEPEPEEPFEEVPVDKVALVHQGLRILASMDHDHARDLNNCGFSKMDTDFGCSLAARESLTPKMAAAGLKLCRRYRRQLPADLVAALGVGGKAE